MNDDCFACKGDGYFGDYGPGIYPLPCPFCAGIGLAGLASEEMLEAVNTIRETMYKRISAEIGRPNHYGLAFEAGVMGKVELESGHVDAGKTLLERQRDYMDQANDFSHRTM